MNAITVCVDYSDILEITLKTNRVHFDKFVVVTSLTDLATVELCSRSLGVICYQTDAFYRDGAMFRKWLALEEGLDVLGRSGWIAVIDADIVMPSRVNFSGARIGRLYTPRRRILADASQWKIYVDGDSEWDELPLNRNEEWAGYFQLFHASDAALIGKSHWYDPMYSHAGVSDSLFAAHWCTRLRARPPFEVLHLGEDGKNWCGRATPHIDGTIPPQAAERSAELQRLLTLRTKTGNFKAEKIASST